ncbi:MAG: DUF1501 domain-containing protein [Bacteroidetes bacterium]|nr:DUF1501 domain-containing protein [Bacteroidota bacterium]
MKRRNFLKILPAAGVTPIAVNGFPLRPFANSKMAKILSACDGIEDRVLVLIQLKGGNDGINNIIALPQYDTYANIRPNIRIAQDAAIVLDSGLATQDQVGLHPSLAAFKTMYEEGTLAIVQGAGYANMNQSHFKGTDLWLTGGDTTSSNFNLTTGWMGRALQAFYPDVAGAPTADMPDPLGIQIGDTNPSLGFHTETEHQNVINLSGQDPSGFFSLIQTIGGAPILNIPDTDQGAELAYIMGVEQSVNDYAQRITEVFDNGSNALNSYPDTNLAAQLKTIARMIKGGCKTKIYLCQHGGFDTHSGQVDAAATTEGTHAELLLELAEAVQYFFNDLKAMGLDEQVIGCTFSEFGRCARENGSNGTDHGTLAPMYLFGKNVKAGVFGTNVDLNDLTNDGQLKHLQFDYRQVFATLLQDWLGANPYIMEQTMFEGYTKIAALDADSVVDPGCYWGEASAVSNVSTRPRKLQVFPNPASVTAEINYESSDSFDAILSLHSLGGSLVSSTLVRILPGNNLFYLDVISIPPGPYFARLENKRNGAAEVVKINVVR